MEPGKDIDFIESRAFELMERRLALLPDTEARRKFIANTVKSIQGDASQETIDQIIKDSESFGKIEPLLNDPDIEDIMINNTSNIFAYTKSSGHKKMDFTLDKKDLDILVKRLKLYATTTLADDNISDIHLPNGSRANIVSSPMGANVTIRNFSPVALSIIDLINAGELSYNLAARLWIYVDGLKVRPANLLIGGIPGSGKTTLLNAMFSFFRPEQRIVVLEETYELNTETQENCVRLETSPELPLTELVKNTLRMRPDMIIIGEVRGEEAKDMMTAMNIGKMVMCTIHASTARDAVTRLQHSPMNIEMDILPLIDAIIIISQIEESGKRIRKISQVSEISGIETQVLLSDLYSYDYKTHHSSEILPSVTYRDLLSRLSGYPPSEIILEEQRRAKILERLNQLGIKGLKDICKEYYTDPEKALEKIGLSSLGVLR